MKATDGKAGNVYKIVQPFILGVKDSAGINVWHYAKDVGLFYNKHIFGDTEIEQIENEEIKKACIKDLFENDFMAKRLFGSD